MASSKDDLESKAGALADSLESAPADASEAAVKVTRVRAPGADPHALARHLAEWYRTQELKAEVLDTNQRDRAVVQCRSSGWLTTVGMSRALTVVLRRDGADLAIEVGSARWLDKGVAAGAGLVLYPLLVTAAVGGWRQWRLSGQTIEIVKAAIASGTEGAPAPPEPERVIDEALAGAAAAPGARPVDVNAAGESELSALPGIGRVTAKRILQERERSGGFRSLEDFAMAVDIKPHILDRLEPLLEFGPRQQVFRPSGRTGRVVE